MITTPNQKGFVLIFTVLLVVVFFILISVISGSSIVNYSIAKANEYSEKAYYLAYGGIEYGIFLVTTLSFPEDPTLWYDLDNDPSTTEDLPDFGVGELDLDIIQIPPDYKITSTGRVSGRARTIKVTVTKAGTIKAFE